MKYKYGFVELDDEFKDSFIRFSNEINKLVNKRGYKWKHDKIVFYWQLFHYVAINLEQEEKEDA